MSSDRRNRDRRTARGPSERSQRRLLLVVCEGNGTEPDYIHGFVRHQRDAMVKVTIPRERGDPKKVVEIAKKINGASGDDFDEVWCVFDRDEHERFFDAITMARDNGFELAISNPCFELWLVLHFRESPGMQHRDHLRRMLRDLLPGYDKRLNFDDLAGGVAAAAGRARRLDEDAEAMGEDGRNPTTGVYRLLNSISTPN